MAALLEFGMLFAFGFSWPFDGKSPMFMVIVILGYCCGIASHLVEGTKLWLVAVYLVDIALVSTDLALYCVYSRRNSAAAVN